MYWQIGQRIFEEEQQGKDRANYGNYLTKFIADQLEPEYGSGFSKRQIELFRQFYRTFPIANAVRSQMYVNYYDRYEKKDFEKPTIGILLCAEKNNAVVKISLPENNRTIFASEYKLYLPTEEQLIEEVKKEIDKRNN